MPTIRIVTLNLLNDLSRWKARRELVAAQLRELDADLVALQEVSLPENTAAWLADQLGYAHLSLAPKMNYESGREAIAILSRHPFEAENRLDLGAQQRVAQSVQVRIADQPLKVVNTHLFWQPGNSPTRLRQVGRMIAWLQNSPSPAPTVICGDFNSTPETPSIRVMKQHFRSAYAVMHGHEPEHTCPTPLPRSLKATLRTLLGFLLLLRPRHIEPGWKGTLDYIFIQPELRVRDCRIVLDKPDGNNPKIYPSDHVGIFATLEIGA